MVLRQYSSILHATTVFGGRLEDAVELDQGLLPDTSDFSSGDIADEPYEYRKQNDCDCLTCCDLHFFHDQTVRLRDLTVPAPETKKIHDVVNELRSSPRHR